MHFLVLRHVCLVAEIIKIPGIGLRVQFWDERRTLRSKSVPINLGEVLVVINILNVAEALGLGCNTATRVSFAPNWANQSTYLVMKFQVLLLMK